ncbi:MAG: hypothetical protein ACLFRX_11620, partial [Gemmatimonadota bacterium]
THPAMDLTAWLLYSFLATLALAAAVLHYRHREAPVRGRLGLGILRGAAFALLLLLLFDPVLPAPRAAGRPVVALVDVSLSMTLPVEAEGGRTRWAEARAVVAELGPDRVRLFGTPEAPVVDRLPDRVPVAPASRLAPALRAALESGAGRVVVVTDRAVEDEAEARRLAAEAGVPVEVRAVGERTPVNLGVAEVAAPTWVEAGEVVAIEAAVARLGEGRGEDDSVTVVLERDGRELDRTRVGVPAVGRTSPAALRFRPAAGEEVPVRLDVRVLPGGSARDDDVRSVYVRIAAEPAGVALISFRPDQEPRFLLPVLERALGLPARGWLALPGERYIRLGTEGEAGQVTGSATVRGALDGADLVVLHGIREDSPPWARRVLRQARRLLVFPGDPAPEAVPWAPSAPRAGEWYLSAEVPASPVAALLAGMPTEELPPLTGVREPGGVGAWSPVMARLARRGEEAPVVVVGVSGGRRVAVALADGYWRWAFAGPAGREVYDRTWAALAGWLMGDAGGAETIRPEPRVVHRGDPVRWVAPAGADSARITAWPDGPVPSDARVGAAAPATDTVVAVRAGAAATAPLPAGHYRYEARVVAGEAGAAGRAAAGPFTVDAYSPELTRPAVALALESREDSVEPGRAGRPLHAMAWPYVLLVILLCAEWVVRRRVGLR